MSNENLKLFVTSFNTSNWYVGFHWEWGQGYDKKGDPSQALMLFACLPTVQLGVRILLLPFPPEKTVEIKIWRPSLQQKICFLTKFILRLSGFHRNPFYYSERWLHHSPEYATHIAWILEAYGVETEIYNPNDIPF